MDFYAFDDLLITCSEHISKHGFQTESIPPIIKGWLAEKIVTVLPPDFIKTLLNKCLQTKHLNDLQQSISMKTEVSYDSTRITLEIFKNPETRLENQSRETARLMGSFGDSNFKHQTDTKNQPELFYTKGQETIAKNLEFFADEMVLIEDESVNYSKNRLIFNENRTPDINQGSSDFESEQNSSDEGLNTKNLDTKSKKLANSVIHRVVKVKAEHKCQLCGKRYPLRNSMYEHQKKQHPEFYNSQRKNGIKPYHRTKAQLEAELYQDKHECPFCQKYYLNPLRLSEHIKKFHPDEFVQAKQDTPSGEWYYNLPPQFSRVRCHVCNLRFQNLKEMHSHQEKKHPEFWAVKFAAKQAIKAHLSCEVCGKQFEHKKSLVHHMYSHSGAHPFKCNVCDMGLATKSKLERHSKSHNKT